MINFMVGAYRNGLPISRSQFCVLENGGLPEFNAMYFLPVNNVDFDFSHTRNNTDDFPDATLDDAGNYCTNPDGEPNLWCYTTNSSSRREFCDVPLCEGETLDKNIIN